MQLILKEQQERGLHQIAYTWSNDCILTEQGNVSKLWPGGTQAFPHPRSLAGGRETEQGGSGGLGLLNT